MADTVYLESLEETDVLLSKLSQPVRDWFKDKFPDFTDPQKMAIPSIVDGEHLLLCSPTGSGKTLTAFLSIIDKLVRLAMDGDLEKKVYCIYISPIKALANDIQRNLIGPLTEIKERFLPGRSQEIKVGLRTGDTPQSERQKMLRNPPHILITTPESLGLALASKKFRPLMHDLKWLIIDEMHSLVPTKRGTHLALTMALLDTLIANPVQRLGISATMEPLEEVAHFLVPAQSEDREIEGGAPVPKFDDEESSVVHIAKVSGVRELDLDIILPHPKFSEVPVKKLLDHNVDIIKDLVEAHTTTLVFANTRQMTEIITQKLRVLGLAGVEGHHGSMDKQIRLEVERKLKRGELRCCVSSSSLEMGIDIGSVDMVIQLGSPGSIATALQRIGRAGHHVGGIPRARFLPTSSHDLLELVALQGAIMSGDMDLLRFPNNCLDVLAQFIIGLTICGEIDMDEAFSIITSAYPYRNLPYDDYIEVLDLLEDERRVWVDWEENIIGKRGYAQMIYYTNIGTIAPDNNYLVFSADGTMIGQLSSSFVQNIRPGDVFLLGGSTYRVHQIQASRVSVTSVTGYRPTVPSWSGESASRSRELSQSVLNLLNASILAIRRGRDPRVLLSEAYGLSKPVTESLARYLEEHAVESIQVPSPDKIMIEQIMNSPIPTYIITTCRGRAFNMALGYFMAGLCDMNNIHVVEMSFDENSFLFKTGQEIDTNQIYPMFKDNQRDAVLQRYLLDSQLFAKRFREVSGRSMIVPRRIGADEVSPKQFQQKSEKVFREHRQHADSLLIREAQNEIFHTDLDMEELEKFVNRMDEEGVRIVHSRVTMPSALGMNLYMAAFEDLLSMRTRAYLVKDIDPEILKRLLGGRSRATDLDEASLDEYFQAKAKLPEDADGLLRLMEKGGGLHPDLKNPLYQDKLSKIPYQTVHDWVVELAAAGAITKVRSTGSNEIDEKWYSIRMSEVHGTLGVLSTKGADQMDDLRELYTGGLHYEVAKSFDGDQPQSWGKAKLMDPHEALRIKIADMLGSEGPKTLANLSERLPFPQAQIESLLHELEVRNIVSIGFYRQTEEGEFILRVDEHIITGGEDNVIEYRQLQNLLLSKSFKPYPDALTALSDGHVMFAKMQELLGRVENFRFADWKDMKHDSDIVMGRLLHSRVGYTTKSMIPMLLGLRPEPWFSEMDAELSDFIPPGENVERTQIIGHLPRGDEFKHVQRDARNSLSNMERQMVFVKQFEELIDRKRSLSLFHRVHDVYEPMPFPQALEELIRRIGPIKLHSLRLFVSHPVELLAEILRDLESENRVTRVTALQPDPTDFFCVPTDAKRLEMPVREDRALRILSQSDPFCSRFIQEVRYVLKQGWYYPVFKGVDPVGRILMFKVNDYLEIKDIHIPHAYLDEFSEIFETLLTNYKDTLVDVSVLHAFNGVPIHDCDENILAIVEKLGFKTMGDGLRFIRGGVVDPRPRSLAIRALFHHHRLHQDTRAENETLALNHIPEVRDDFALRGRCETSRVDLKSMAASQQLHLGTNLRNHQVWAPYKHFQRLLRMRGVEADEDLLDVLEFFSGHSDPKVFMDRYAMKRAAFRKIVQPLVRSGHIVQDYRGGFKTVHPLDSKEVWDVKREYLREMIAEYPVMTLKQLEKLAGSPFKPEQLASVLHEFEAEGHLIKGFLIDDLHEVCWGRQELLENADKLPPMRDFVLPPSDPLLPYFQSLLRERFGYGSAYMVFSNEEPIAAFKANTRNDIIEVTDFVGDSEREKEALRVMKEFAWEHNMPLKGKVLDRLKSR
ncbi:MAG: DEAD/DEAH box helicase [Candidatus Thalassarchaeaceae archaeon]|nr:DEAD/DEAH box helicase [Candidatus Thalassarchaeaceae archaeon]